MTQRFINVYPATHRLGEFAFGDLQALGHLTKRYQQESRWDPDSFTIVWTVVGDIEFTTTRGDTFRQGDVIEWPK